MKIRFDKFEQQQADVDKGVRISYGGSKRYLASWRWYFILVIICSPLIFFLIKFATYFFLVQGTSYIEVHHVDVRATENGYVKKISVKSMQQVNSATLLFAIEQPDLAEKEETLSSELSYLMNNKGNHLIGTKQTSIDDIDDQKAYMKKRLDNFIQLFNQGAATDAEVKTARFQYQAVLEHMNTIARPTLDVESQEKNNRIRQLILEKNQLNRRLKLMSAYAPVEGKISDILVSEGEYVSRGDLVVTIMKNGKALINTYLGPEYIEYAEVGRMANVRFANGEKVLARVVTVPSLTKPIPLDAITSFGTRDRAIFLQLEFMEVVKQQLMNGAPVKVVF